MTREDVKKAAEKIVMDWRNADRPALEKFLPKELAEIINAALEEAAKFIELPAGLPIVMDMDGIDLLSEGVRALKIP